MSPTDLTPAKCNLRKLDRYPLPVSRASSTDFPWVLACLGLTVLAYAAGYLIGHL